MALALTYAAPARADGEFFQLDIAEGATDFSLAIARGRLNLGGNYARYDGGSSGSLSLLWSIPVDPLGTFKVGPSVARILSDTDPDRTRVGAKITFERWSPTEFGHLFLLGEYSTIDNSYFGLVQTGFGNSGFAAELSVGGSDNYSAITAAVSKRIGEGPLVLRAGYRFKAETLFVGFAINTF
ncbi:hypothetical protein ATO6_21435 [Oceanicola sp. 22II-s10i]|nr:hypothetical protein ATO6_21435 [Oceanicola sp. 22II-s10i]